MLFVLLAVIIVIAGAYLMFKKAPKADSVETYNYSENTPKPTEETNMNEQNLQKPELTIDTNKTYNAVLKTTEGDITVELSNATPITTNNFIYLSRQGFYNGTIFHRVIDDFMIQGGDPTGTGMGSPGYRFDDEPFTGEYTRGTIAMANSGPNTNGSQFFIMHADYPLPKNYVIFGKAVGGLEVVDKIATAETSIGPGGEKSKPVSPVKINSVEIIEK